jgi:hypothetical protein
MRIVIFDVFNGAGGDMIVGSLIGISLTRDDLLDVVDRLSLKIEIDVEEESVKGIMAKKLTVKSERTERTYKEVINIIENSKMDEEVIKASKDIFTIIAKAEGKIHGRNYRDSVFHEVGSDDAIFDIVSAVKGIIRLKNDGYSFYSTPVRLGEGFIEIKHGKYPVPAPATLEILSNSSLEVILGGEGELFTPTAAAILSYFCKGVYRHPFKVERVSYGAGTRETSLPNVLRLIVGRTLSHDSVVLLETLIDDTSGEIIAHAIEKIGEVALDVSATPVTGKKGRPGIILRAISDFLRAEEVAERIISETGSLGVRIYPVYHRLIAPRELKSVDVEIHGEKFQVRVKKSGLLLKPEFEDVKRIAESLEMPLVVVYRKILERIGE